MSPAPPVATTSTMPSCPSTNATRSWTLCAACRYSSRRARLSVLRLTRHEHWRATNALSAVHFCRLFIRCRVPSNDSSSFTKICTPTTSVCNRSMCGKCCSTTIKWPGVGNCYSVMTPVAKLLGSMSLLYDFSESRLCADNMASLWAKLTALDDFAALGAHWREERPAISSSRARYSSVATAPHAKLAATTSSICAAPSVSRRIWWMPVAVSRGRAISRQCLWPLAHTHRRGLDDCNI
jgi:hypothetical protein